MHELPITKHTELGTFTVVVLMQGIKSMCFAFPISPIIDIVWSIPPHAVPALRSEVIHRSARSYLGTLSIIPFACIVVTAAQTTKAELELKPAAGGT